MSRSVVFRRAARREFDGFRILFFKLSLKGSSCLLSFTPDEFRWSGVVEKKIDLGQLMAILQRR